MIVWWRIAIDRDRAADERRVAREPPLRPARAGASGSGQISSGRNCRQDRLDAASRFAVTSDAKTRSGSLASDDGLRPRSISPAKSVNACALLEIPEELERHEAAVEAGGRARPIDDHHIVGRPDRQRPDDDRVDDAEDSGVDADPESETDDRDGGEPWRFHKGPQRVSNVLEEAVHAQ
jgi:hypothetical protein